MTDLSALRTAWHLSQKDTLRAMAELFETWTPLNESRYFAATRAEKNAEHNYLKALAARPQTRAQQQ